ncbi:MAG: hypothetical protein M3N34_00990 [Pseudomonadota bacterium]|nr:hypothetical protein [Pseudomonadota bacterium]
MSADVGALRAPNQRSGPGIIANSVAGSSPGIRLAALIGAPPAGGAANRNLHRAAAIAAPAGSSRMLHQFAAPTHHEPVAPGFHRTVRQPQSTSAPGHVYLDKSLVGYHLAAAITAEQTRAAARPNVSGASFNSSMAALRPSGAGL